MQERRELTRSEATLESAIHDEEERSERSGSSRIELEEKLRQLDARISETEGELMGLIPLLADKEKELAQARATLDDSKAKIDVLFAKQSRSNQYNSQADRDAALREELTSLGEYDESLRRQMTEAAEEGKDVQGRIGEIEHDLVQKADQLEERKRFIEQRGQAWEELKKQEDALMEKKK